MTTGVVLPDAPDSIAGQPLFAVHHVEFTVADVVRAARPGDRELVAPAGRATEVQEDFRRSRGLLTSDQLIDWLAARAVSPEQFQEWSESPTDATWAAFVCSGTLE